MEQKRPVIGLTLTGLCKPGIRNWCSKLKRGLGAVTQMDLVVNFPKKHCYTDWRLPTWSIFYNCCKYGFNNVLRLALHHKPMKTDSGGDVGHRWYEDSLQEIHPRRWVIQGGVVLHCCFVGKHFWCFVTWPIWHVTCRLVLSFQTESGMRLLDMVHQSNIVTLYENSFFYYASPACRSRHLHVIRPNRRRIWMV